MRPLAAVGLLLALTTSAYADTAAPRTVAVAPLSPIPAEDDSAYTRVEIPRDYRDRHVAIGVTLGLATPLGFAGAELTWRPKPFFEISAGAGVGARGMQVAAMPRLILRGETVSAFLGAGLSAGNFGTSSFNLCISVCTSDVENEVEAQLLWANSEAGLEVGKRQLFARATLGAGRVIGDRDVIGNRDLLPSWLPYTSITLGHRF